MAKAEATVEELVDMIERGELRLPEMQRRYAWRSTRVRDLLDSLYRGYQVTRAAGQVETLLGLAAHTNFDLPARPTRGQEKTDGKS